MFRVSKPDVIRDSDTIDGAREIVRGQPPARGPIFDSAGPFAFDSSGVASE
jgi:hypothetical protein